MLRTTCSNGLWAICLLFALYTAWAGLLPGSVPSGIDAMAVTVLLVVFALVHGALRYGWSSILIFVILCLFVSNASENLSILTGFPFGRYYYTDVLGPKLFLVPVLIGGAYTGAGYLSWIVAHVLLDRMGPSDRFAVWALPVIGAILMVSWDLTFDPSASTVGKSWIWIEGGGFFGVPFQNFVGWYLTVFLFLAPFSWYQSMWPVSESQNRDFWAQAIMMYFLLGLRYPLVYTRTTDSRPVTDPGGHIWNTSDIRLTAALVAIFTMIAFALIAWLRLCDRIKHGGGVS
jgi:uncharacterized membrane protein